MGSAERQGALWGARADDWSTLIEPLMRPLYEAVFDEIGLGDRTRYLDVGCGSGVALEVAAARGAHVAGLDAAAPLLDVARGRVPDGDLRHGDLESLPFDDETFDVVTSFNAVQYAADPVAALRELRRAAVPGAAVVVATWAEPERCETRVVLAALRALLPPPPPGAGGPFALSAPGKLEELLTEAGFTPKSAGEVPVPFVYADLDTAVRANLSSGPARMAIEHAGEEVTADALRGAFADSRRPDGTYRQENSFRYVVATAASW